MDDLSLLIFFYQMPKYTLCYNAITGDDRYRRKRLTPDREPRGAVLVKSAQNLKCQPH